MKMKKLSKAKIDSAKNLFMEYMSVRKIADHVGCSPGAVQYYINKEWGEERDLIRVENQQNMKDVKQVEFSSIAEYTIHIMKAALVDLATRERPPTISEAKQASEIMNILDKITRLDKGEATDIVSNQEKALTVETIAKKLKLDPFQPKAVSFEDIIKIND
jgi:predicted transcriptional regulator